MSGQENNNTPPQLPSQGTRGLAPRWRRLPRRGAWLPVQLVEGACSWLPLTIRGPGWLGPRASFWGPFSFLGPWGCLLGIPHSGAALAHVEGRGALAPGLPQDWPPGAVEGDLSPPALQQGTALCAQGRTCPLLDQKPSLLPGECGYLTAPCLGFPRGRKR